MHTDLVTVLLAILSFLPFVGMAWTDSVQTQTSADPALTLSVNDNVNNWADATPQNLGQRIASSDSFTLTDSVSNQAVGRLVITDSEAAWSDEATVLGAGLLTASDSINNWNDSVALGKGVSVADSLAAFTDAAIVVRGYQLSAADDLANWAEAHQLLLGERLALSDTITLADAVSTNVGTQSSPLTINASDSNVQADFEPILALSYDAVVNDGTNTLSDAANVRLGLLLVVADNAANWADAVLVGRGLPLTASDNFNNWNEFVVTFPRAPLLLVADDSLPEFTDFTPEIDFDYVVVANDSFSFTDASNQRIDAAIPVADSANNWNDSVTLTRGLTLTISDSGINWSDSVATFPAAPLPLVISDSVNQWNDLFPLLSLDYQAIVGDSVNNWVDSVAILSGGARTLEIVDSVNNWNDSVDLLRSDAVVVSDSLPAFAEQVSHLSVGELKPFDSFSFSDSVSLPLFLDVEDDADYVDDEVEYRLSGGSELSQHVTDVLTQDDDVSLRTAGFLEVADNTSQFDSVNLFIPLSVTVNDSGIVWQDSASTVTATAAGGITLSISDMLPGMNDSAQIVGVFMSGSTDVYSRTDARTWTVRDEDESQTWTVRNEAESW